MENTFHLYVKKYNSTIRKIKYLIIFGILIKEGFGIAGLIIRIREIAFAHVAMTIH